MEINLVTILSLVVALFVGYFISGFIKSKKQNNQSLEEVLKRYFETLGKELSSTRKDITDNIYKALYMLSVMSFLVLLNSFPKVSKYLFKTSSRL